MPDFFNYILPLTYLLLFLVFRLSRNRTDKIWPVFLVIGFMVTFHVFALMLLPFFLVDGQRHFVMTRDLILWVSYKIMNFATGKTLGAGRVAVKDKTLYDILNFFKLSIFPDRFPVWLGLVIAIFLGGYFLKNDGYGLQKRLMFISALFQFPGYN